jgi:hypothetical protein
VAEIGSTSANILDKLDEARSVLDPKPTLTFVGIDADNREILCQRECRDDGSLIFDRVPLFVRGHANILCSALSFLQFV